MDWWMGGRTTRIQVNPSKSNLIRFEEEFASQTGALAILRGHRLEGLEHPKNQAVWIVFGVIFCNFLCSGLFNFDLDGL
jgi:hypothetical protein